MKSKNRQSVRNDTDCEAKRKTMNPKMIQRSEGRIRREKKKIRRAKEQEKQSTSGRQANLKKGERLRII